MVRGPVWGPGAREHQECQIIPGVPGLQSDQWSWGHPGSCPHTYGGIERKYPLPARGRLHFRCVDSRSSTLPVCCALCRAQTVSPTREKGSLAKPWCSSRNLCLFLLPICAPTPPKPLCSWRYSPHLGRGSPMASLHPAQALHTDVPGSRYGAGFTHVMFLFSYGLENMCN